MSGLGVVLAAVLLAIVVGIVALNLYGQRQRDQELLTRWDGLCAQQNATPGTAIIEVIRVYQRATRGTKAHVVVAGSNQWQDAWFEGTAMRPAPHSIWLVKLPAPGWGPHNQNPVLYLYPEHLLGMAPPGTMEALERRSRTENRRRRT
jgi:hypothetical protein